MDRIDAMKVFVAAVDEGSLAGAGRKLRRSPAAVSRAIAFLEAHVGTELLHRTTRALKLSEAGERYVAACRRVLAELEEADIAAGGERAAPRGTLTLTAPMITGEAALVDGRYEHLHCIDAVHGSFRCGGSLFVSRQNGTSLLQTQRAASGRARCTRVEWPLALASRQKKPPRFWPGRLEVVLGCVCQRRRT